MKCQILFSRKNKNKISKCRLLNFTQHAKMLNFFYYYDGENTQVANSEVANMYIVRISSPTPHKSVWSANLYMCWTCKPRNLGKLSRITTYLEVKIRCLLKHGNLTTGYKILWKKGAISYLFHNIFNISVTLRVKFHINMINVAVRFIFPLISANLICRGTDTDISKYFR